MSATLQRDRAAVLAKSPGFIRDEDGTFHFGSSSGEILFSVAEDQDYVYVCQRVASRETDALFGLLIRSILSGNDHVVISEE